MEGKTAIVIAHRLATVRRADVIFVLDKGVIVERGTHDDLLARGGLYAELYEIQFKREDRLRKGRVSAFNFRVGPVLKKS